MKSLILFLCAMLSSLNAQELMRQELSTKQAQEIIKEFEPFFKEAMAQKLESFKLKKDSITGFSSSDINIFDV